MVSKNINKAYSEVDEFLRLLPDNEREKIPKEIREKIKIEKDVNYIPKIDPNVDVINQDLKKETLAIIAMLNLKFWCEDDEEKERLIKIYEQNKKYNSLSQIGFDQDIVFSKPVGENKEELLIITKESILKKILNKIKAIFKIFNKNR